MLYGLSSINHLAISGWRFAMLIVGGLTICIGIAFYWAVPIDAASAWFLTKEERDCAVQRVSRERASAVHKEWMWDQCWETVKSPMVRSSSSLDYVKNLLMGSSTFRSCGLSSFAHVPFSPSVPLSSVVSGSTSSW